MTTDLGNITLSDSSVVDRADASGTDTAGDAALSIDAGTTAGAATDSYSIGTGCALYSGSRQGKPDSSLTLLLVCLFLGLTVRPGRKRMAQAVS